MYKTALILGEKFIEYYNLIEEAKEEVSVSKYFEQTQILNKPDNAFLSKENFKKSEEIKKIMEVLLMLRNKFDDNPDSIDLEFNTCKCNSCGCNNKLVNSRCYNCNVKFESCLLTGLNINNEMVNNKNSLVKCNYCDNSFLKSSITEFWKVFDYCPYCLNQVIFN